MSASLRKRNHTFIILHNIDVQNDNEKSVQANIRRKMNNSTMSIATVDCRMYIKTGVKQIISKFNFDSGGYKYFQITNGTKSGSMAMKKLAIFLFGFFWVTNHSMQACINLYIVIKGLIAAIYPF